MLVVKLKIDYLYQFVMKINLFEAILFTLIAVH